MRVTLSKEDQDQESKLETLRENCFLRAELCVYPLCKVYLGLLRRRQMIDSDQKATFEISEEAIFHEIKNIFRKLGEKNHTHEQSAINALGDFFAFIAELTPERFEKYQVKILNILSEIYKGETFAILAFSDHLMNTFLQKFSFPPFSILLLDFMNNFYPKLHSESENDKIFRNHFFSKLKAFLEYLDQQNKMNYYSFSKEKIINCQKIFELYLKVLVYLLNQQPTVDFFELYEKANQDQGDFNFIEFIFPQVIF